MGHSGKQPIQHLGRLTISQWEDPHVRFSLSSLDPNIQCFNGLLGSWHSISHKSVCGFCRISKIIIVQICFDCVFPLFCPSLFAVNFKLPPCVITELQSVSNTAYQNVKWEWMSFGKPQNRSQHQHKSGILCRTLHLVVARWPEFTHSSQILSEIGFSHNSNPSSSLLVFCSQGCTSFQWNV